MQVGDRVQWSDVAKISFAPKKNQSITGTITSFRAERQQARVKWDGIKEKDTVHASLLMRVCPSCDGTHPVGCCAKDGHGG